MHAYGPVDGRRHDTTVLRESGLAAAHLNLTVNGVDYCIYADLPLLLHLITQGTKVILTYYAIQTVHTDFPVKTVARLALLQIVWIVDLPGAKRRGCCGSAAGGGGCGSSSAEGGGCDSSSGGGGGGQLAVECTVFAVLYP